MANKKTKAKIDDSSDEKKKLILNPLQTLSSFEDDQIDNLGGNFGTYNFGFSGYKKLVEMINKPDLNFQQVSELIMFLRYFQDNLGASVRIKEDFERALQEFLKEQDFDDPTINELKENFQEKLWRLFNSKSESKDWHQRGLIDVLLDFDGFIDLRPVFHEKEVIDLLPIIIFRAALQKDYENPKNIVFQMSLDDFNDFKNKIADIQQRLDSILKKLASQDTLKLLQE